MGPRTQERQREVGRLGLPTRRAWPKNVSSSSTWHSTATVDPAQMGGLPCIRVLRVTVSMLLGQLAAGRTPDDIVADYQ